MDIFSVFILSSADLGQSPEEEQLSGVYWFVCLFACFRTAVFRTPNFIPAPDMQDVVPKYVYLIFPECSS